jgi:hypothetical protein
MKKIASAVVLLALFAVPGFAAGKRFSEPRPEAAKKFEVRKLDRSKAWFNRILAQAQDARRRDVGANAIIINRSGRQLVIPSAGSVRGANNTFYRSDVTFANWNLDDQDIAIAWFPNNNPDGFEVFAATLPGGVPPFTVEDFVGAFLELEGLGALVFLPIFEDDFDPDAAIDIYSRIWSPQPNASGIVSFPFPAVDFNHLNGEFEAIILGLRQDSAHRTNVGIVNHSFEVDLVFRVSVLTEDGIVAETDLISLPAGSMTQRPIPSGAFGNFSLLVEVDDPDDELPSDFQWTAYASSNNNISNDGWVSIAANPYDDDDLDSASVIRAPRNK